MDVYQVASKMVDLGRAWDVICRLQFSQPEIGHDSELFQGYQQEVFRAIVDTLREWESQIIEEERRRSSRLAQ